MWHATWFCSWGDLGHFMVFIWLKMHQNEFKIFSLSVILAELCQQGSIKYELKPLLDTNSIMTHWSQAN